MRPNHHRRRRRRRRRFVHPSRSNHRPCQNNNNSSNDNENHLWKINEIPAIASEVLFSLVHPAAPTRVVVVETVRDHPKSRNSIHPPVDEADLVDASLWKNSNCTIPKTMSVAMVVVRRKPHRHPHWMVTMTATMILLFVRTTTRTTTKRAAPRQHLETSRLLLAATMAMEWA